MFFYRVRWVNSPKYGHAFRVWTRWDRQERLSLSRDLTVLPFRRSETWTRRDRGNLLSVSRDSMEKRSFDCRDSTSRRISRIWWFFRSDLTCLKSFLESLTCPTASNRVSLFRGLAVSGPRTLVVVPVNSNVSAVVLIGSYILGNCAYRGPPIFEQLHRKVPSGMNCLQLIRIDNSAWLGSKNIRGSSNKSLWNETVFWLERVSNNAKNHYPLTDQFSTIDR